MMFGPGSVFAGKKNENKKESISRTASSSNMFSMLSSQTAEIADSTAKRTFSSSLNLQILTAFLAVEPQRKRLVLQPRSKPVEATESTEGVSPDADSDTSVDDSPSPAAENPTSIMYERLSLAPITAGTYRRSSSAPIPDTETARAQKSFLQTVSDMPKRKPRAASTRP
jgi:hypothetical protein